MNDQGAKINRRTLLTGAGVAALAPVAAHAYTADEGLPDDINAALNKFRSSIPSNFDHDYVEHVVVPFFLSSVYQGERPLLPMIDLPLTKENALPYDLWGLIYKEWKPTPEEGVTVFLQGLENRGDDNLRKRIYFSAMTPDLYGPKYQKKVVAFFDQLLDPKFAGKPFMRHYLDYYFDIYWDLHLGVKGDAIPAGVRQIGESFNTVLAYRNPTRQIVYENYTEVRELLDPLKEWIDARVKDLESGRTAGSRQDDCLVLAQERRERGALQPQGHCLRMSSTTSSRSANGATRFSASCRVSASTAATRRCRRRS